jgi:hypothetical protein
MHEKAGILAAPLYAPTIARPVYWPKHLSLVSPIAYGSATAQLIALFYMYHTMSHLREEHAHIVPSFYHM